MLALSRAICEGYMQAFSNTGNTRFLKKYQYLIVKYFNSPAFRSKQLLLLFMEVGTGKTLTSLAC